MADLHTDLWSINDLVLRSNSKDEARDRFENTHGFSLSRHAAHLAFNDAVERKFKKKEAQAAYRNQIEAKYKLVEAVLDADTIKQSIEMLKKNRKFNELKKYYDTVRKDLIDSSSLSHEEASSVINYAIHK